MPQSIFRRAATGLLAAFALAAAGCGAGAMVHVQGRRVSLALDEYRILPRTLSVPPGRIQIAVRNRGVLTHNVALEREGRDASGKPVILGSPPRCAGAGGSILTPRRPRAPRADQHDRQPGGPGDERRPGRPLTATLHAHPA
jgi:hypothetical protein